MLSVIERDYCHSGELLREFQEEEGVFGCEWDDAEDENAKYIWVVDIRESEWPIGFLAYKTLRLKETTEFIYILKLYVINKYRGEDAVLMESERVSKVLFDRVIRKGFQIITLEPSCDRLDEHYQHEFGFKYVEIISEKFASVIGAINNRKILYWIEYDEVQNDLIALYGIR